MKIFYDPKTGEIYYAVKNIDYSYFTHTTNIPLEIGEIPEDDESYRAVRVALLESQDKRDKEGRARFFIDTKAMEIVEREGWTEWVEAVMEVRGEDGSGIDSELV
jgi:hypothetical protein